MNVLMLTWEYPPFIVGGLGMACYGLFKALAELGVTIKMILPTKEEVFYQITNPMEADFPIARKENGLKVDPKPLRFLPFLYEFPEESVYTTIKELIPKSIQEMLPSLPLGSKEIPSEVLERIKFLLSQYNNVVLKVRLYTENVLKIAQKISFDIVHAHDWLTYPAGLYLKKVFKKPLIMHIHATEFDRALGFGHPLIHEIEYLGLHYADKIIAVSHYTKGIILEHYFVPEEKIEVVHNALTVRRLYPEKKKKFKKPVVLFLGRLTPQKGPKVFLEIAKKVAEQYKDVLFVIAGAGEMERELMLEASALGLGTQILFIGFLNREEVEEALNLADIVVMPSVSEPFGIVALEALYFGCALIISKQSGASEVIQNAFKVDFWDIDKMVNIIIDLLTHPEKLKEIQLYAKNEAKKFSWSVPAKKILNIYQSLLK
ncbi:MAG: glycosyltransferase family 4 protein [Caldimicrobium sp.]